MEFIQYISGSMIAMVIGGLLTSLFGFLASVSKVDRTPRWLCWCSFVAGIIIVVAGIMSGVSDARDAAIIQKKTQRIENLTSQNNALVGGGDNYCSFHLFVSASNTLNWTIQHRNDHVPVGDKIEVPVLDVKAMVWDIGALTQQANISIQEVLKTLEDPTPDDIKRLSIKKKYEVLENRTVWNIGTVLPHENSTFRKQSFADTDELWFVVWFFARNGRWKESIVLRKVNGKWLSAHKMDRMPPYSPEIRDTHVSMHAGFPTNGLPKGW